MKTARLLSIDGKDIPRGKDFRFGHNKTLEGINLIVWAKTQGDKKTSFKIQAPLGQRQRKLRSCSKRFC